MLPKQRVMGAFAVAVQCTEGTRQDDSRNQFISLPTSRTEAFHSFKAALAAVGLESEAQPLITRLQAAQIIGNRRDRLKAYQAIQTDLQTRLI